MEIINPRKTRSGKATQHTLSNAQFGSLSFVEKWTRLELVYERHHVALPSRCHLRGRSFPDDRPVVGIGGTRSPSVEAFCLAARITTLLAERGAVILSGAVPGIDLAAHSGALGAPEGVTYAVLANPVEHGFGAHEWPAPILDSLVTARGGFLSEYGSAVAVGSGAYRRRLLARDRIISGLSDIFIAFECSRNSATVDTAKRARLQGKPVIGIETSVRTWRDGLDGLRGIQGCSIVAPGRNGEEELVEGILARLATTRL
jgi:hypothetical protein